MDEFDMQDFIKEALDYYYESPSEIKRILTYERAMMMTSNTGLIITLKDGSEFQLTIVQSKIAEEEVVIAPKCRHFLT